MALQTDPSLSLCCLPVTHSEPAALGLALALALSMPCLPSGWYKDLGSGPPASSLACTSYV